MARARRTENNETKFIEVAKIGDEPKKIAVEIGWTFEQVLRNANFDLDANYKLRADGEEVSLDDVVNGHDNLIVVPKVEGGR